jgi:ligand-binding SRPBCC domain-containing protein
MPRFESVCRLARPVAVVFEFFCQPANLLRVTPPDMHVRLLEAPRRLELGSRLTIEVRRWGIGQRIESLVTVFEPDVIFADEQVKGPFRRWVHTHRFAACEGGTRVTDEIEFEAPGGMLGLVVTVPSIERDLQKAFAYRIKQLERIFGR